LDILPKEEKLGLGLAEDVSNEAEEGEEPPRLRGFMETKNVRYPGPLRTSVELELRLVGGEGWGGLDGRRLVSLAWVLGVYPPAMRRQQAALSGAVLGMLKREIPRGLGESYIGHSASQAETCSQLASAFLSLLLWIMLFITQ
jgi:hypothetical protein